MTSPLSESDSSETAPPCQSMSQCPHSGTRSWGGKGVNTSGDARVGKPEPRPPARPLTVMGKDSMPLMLGEREREGGEGSMGSDAVGCQAPRGDGRIGRGRPKLGSGTRRSTDLSTFHGNGDAAVRPRTTLRA